VTVALTVGGVSVSFVEISAGVFHTCGRTQNNAVYCWGDNYFGEVGDGTTTGRLIPTLVTGGISFVEIRTGAAHTCGRTQNGAVYCWGNSNSGELGDGTRTNRLVPTPVTGGISFVEISLGWAHSCGRTQSGAVYCWGDNDFGGQLGDGTTTDRLTPTPVVGGISFVEISAGGLHSCGRTQNGVVYCWGRNTDGELGDGTTTTRLVPTLVRSP
jgi:alpha-tubulin suppressor-like RCC1 family protein